ncbi:DUF6261 family protein [Marinifilum flexuosum]|uniref:DUF6261 family protein n=1 Tax=Marinifilum flexuosum TaxID=1117708 RepID=UPI0024956A1A|nr:DUF6261 family protein [Marinifilum flexuosum]
MNKNQQLLAHANAKEVVVLGQMFVNIWRYENPKINDQLHKHLKELEQQILILRNAYRQPRKGTYTNDLNKLNKQIASLFMGLKHLVKSYLHHPDEDKRRDAKIMWRLIVAIGVNVHKTNRSKKVVCLRNLVQILSVGELKSEAKNLDGLEVFLAGIEDLIEESDASYLLSAEERAQRKERVQATAQAQKVHKLLNEEILPILFTFQKLEPESYDRMARTFQVSLKKMNQKIRKRRADWVKRREEAREL